MGASWAVPAVRAGGAVEEPLPSTPILKMCIRDSRQDWARGLKIGILFIVSALCLVLYGGSLSFAVFYLPLALINPAVYCFSVSKAE